MWFDTILWLVTIVAFIAVETATTALVSVWFAIGAAAAMFASFFTSSLGIQAAGVRGGIGGCAGHYGAYADPPPERA